MNKRSARLLGNVSMKGWRIRYYAIGFNNDDIDSKENIMDLGVLLSDAESYLSEEFDYLRVGFAFKHRGRRGVTLSLWHWGSWGDTLELFNHGLYRYKDQKEYETLTCGEPLVSMYDFGVLHAELNRAFAIPDLDNNRYDQLKRLYQ